MVSDVPPYPQLLDIISSIQPGFAQEEFDAVIQRVSNEAQLGMSDEDAIQWGEDYFQTLPGGSELHGLTHAANVDTAQLDPMYAHPLAALASARMTSMAPHRLSSTRVQAVTAKLRNHIQRYGIPDTSRFALPIDFAQFERDIALASDFGDYGVPIHTDPSFQLSSATGPCSTRYRLVHTAINAHVLKNRQSGFCILLHRHALDNVLCQIMNLSLAEKYGKAQGLLVSDASSTSSSPPHRRGRGIPAPIPLNTKWVAEEAERIYGPIHHPTLRDIIRAILRFADAHGWDAIVIFKDDLKGFYQQCSFRPSDVHKMVFQVSYPPQPSKQCQWLMVSLAGNFGWSAMPFVMEVITRLLRVLIGWLIFGLMLMYVDDIIVITTQKAFESDRRHVLKTVTDLLGPDSHAPEKFESTHDPTNPEAPHKIDILGWSVNVDTQRVAVAQKNQVRALWWFLLVDVNNGLTLHERERLCSLAERYSAVFPELRILMPAMYQMLGGKSRLPHGARIKIPPQARLAILLWQVYLIMSESDRDRCLPLGRPLIAFGTRPPRGLVEFDGSLDGLGWRLYDSSTESWVASAFMRIPSAHLPVRDPTYQNTMELTALALALFHAIELGWSHSMLHIRGDSRSALTWAKTLNFKSTFAMGASALFVAVCTYGDIHIGEDIHWTTDENFVCDLLSRGDPAAAQERGDCGPNPPRDVSLQSPFQDLLLGCSPAQPLSSPQHFIDLWATFRHVVISSTLTNDMRAFDVTHA